MRSVITDEARARLTAKRGSGAEHTDFAALHDFLPDLSETPEQIVAINDLIDRLETQHPRAAHVVVLRYFGGFTDAETASLLGITDRTVRNDWQFARAWIAEQLNGQTAG